MTTTKLTARGFWITNGSGYIAQPSGVAIPVVNIVPVGAEYLPCVSMRSKH